MTSPPVFQRIERELEGRRREGLFRTTAPYGGSHEIDMSTNSYLALQAIDEVRGEAGKLTQDNLPGNLASRLIATKSPLYEDLERELAAWKRCESALVFNSGYAANVGIIQALSGRDTDIFCDRLNHASIVDGIRLSGAKLRRYRHADVDHLGDLLARSKAFEKIIVTDSVFSMDGDCAPLAAICELAREHDALVMVDEAHACGMFGREMSGMVEALGLEESVHVRIGTLSKALAGLGGFFAGSSLLRDWFVNSSRSLIYSTALPHAAIAWDLAAVRYLRMHPDLGPRLLAKAGWFRDELRTIGFDTLAACTQIVPCVVGDKDSALNLSAYLARDGIRAPCIRPPTVAKGTSRIRFSVHLGLDEEQLARVVAGARRWREKHGT